MKKPPNAGDSYHTGDGPSAPRGSKMPDVSVVVVSWNAKDFVEACLRSLLAQERVSVEVHLVDNASSDATVPHVRSLFPDVIITETGANLGFARANNIGFALCTAKYVAFVNSDVEAPPSTLASMVAFMNANQTIGLLGPSMLGVDGRIGRSTMRLPTLQRAALAAFGLDHVAALLGVGGGFMMRDFAHTQTTAVDVLNGWFWLARREAIQEVGVLDERFFMYGEDIDWCHRFHAAGWGVVFFAGAAATHYGGASSSAAPVRFYIEMHRANLQYWRKHHGRISTFFYTAVGVVHQAVRLCVYTVAAILGLGRTMALTKARRSAASIRWFISGRG